MADVQHSALTSVHRFAHVSSSDPGAVGAFHGWVDTSTSPFTLKVRDSLNTGWASVGASGIDQLADLTDVDLTGLSDGDVLAWNAGASKWVPTTPGAGGAVNLDDLGDVIITSPSTGQVLKFNGTSWVNDTDATGGGGGSIGLYSPDLPYASPNALDDEFDGGSLDAKWTAVNGGSTVHTSFPGDGSMRIYCVESNMNGLYQTTTNVDQTIRAKISPAIDTVNTSVIGLFMMSGANNITEIVFQGATLVVYKGIYTSGAGSSGAFTAATGANPLFGALKDVREFYLEMKYTASGNLVDASVSLDGVTWVPLFTGLSLGGDIGKLGIAVHGTSTIGSAIRWFRKLQGTFTGGTY